MLSDPIARKIKTHAPVNLNRECPVFARRKVLKGNRRKIRILPNLPELVAPGGDRGEGFFLPAYFYLVGILRNFYGWWETGLKRMIGRVTGTKEGAA